MIRGPQQRGPVRLVACEPDVERPYPALGVWLILAVLLAVPVTIGFAWAAYYVVRGLGVVALIWKALLT